MSRSEVTLNSTDFAASDEARLPGFAEALARAAGLPLSEVEALDLAQRSLVRIVGGLEAGAVLTQLPLTLWHTLEACFETGLDPCQCEAVLAAARKYFERCSTN